MQARREGGPESQKFCRRHYKYDPTARRRTRRAGRSAARAAGRWAAAVQGSTEAAASSRSSTRTPGAGTDRSTDPGLLATAHRKLSAEQEL